MSTCGRCGRTNPEAAVFCYFDGIVLRAERAAALGVFEQPFGFPSGRKCRSFEELLTGCTEEWTNAREMLKKGAFNEFFGRLGRADLCRATTEAMAQDDPDIGLVNFLNALPAQRTTLPRLDLSPRRLLLGPVLAGETRQLELRIQNQGQGQLQGILKVTEGGEWLKVGNNAHECPISTSKEQKVIVTISTARSPAGQTFAGQLTVIANGGVAEVPLRMELIAHPFQKAPYQGARTPREIAVLMKGQPKPAVPMLESGEVARWFEGNGWKYPVLGKPARGVASVQQFFEAMGLSKPPPLALSPSELKLRCRDRDTSRHQVTLSTNSRKWVYADIHSDQPWLRVLTPNVYGAQKAPIQFEIDSRGLKHGQGEGRLTVVANHGQTLTAKILAEVHEKPKRTRAPSGLMRSLVVMGLLFLATRWLLAPFVDFFLMDSSTLAAAQKLGQPAEAQSPVPSIGGWLWLPWSKILLLGDGSLAQSWFQPGSPAELSIAEFRHYFLRHFLERFLLWTSWLGPFVGVILLRRKTGGWGESLWGLVAGGVAGILAAATVGCGVLLIDTLPRMLWDLFPFPGHGVVSLLAWVSVAGLAWGALGAGLGALGHFVRPVAEGVVTPLRRTAAGLCQMCGLRGLAKFCTGP